MDVARLLSRHEGKPEPAALEASPALTITMRAPGAFQHFMPEKGLRYSSNESALIENVDAAHMAALIDLGCWKQGEQ
jgi:hypothetical protein